MKIGFYVAEVSVPVGYEDLTSAHVQVPLHCLKLLRDAGHGVGLITTAFAPGEVLPGCMPAGVAVHQVVDPRRKHNGGSRLRPLALFTQLRQIKRIVERERYDVLHFHGFRNAPDLAALAGLMGAKVPFVATVNDADLPPRFWFVRRRLWQRISAFVTSTEFVADRLRACGIRANVVKHGAVRKIKAELVSPGAQAPQRVLFWRDPSLANGIDICLAAFSELAPRFPQINFDVAVRRHWEDWLPALQQLAHKYRNVGVHVFPYADGITLAQLLAESICVVLPFRTLSYHPQLTVLESIEFGTTVITTALGSNVELAHGGRQAMLVPVGDAGATVAAIEKVLRDPIQAQAFAREAAHSVRAAWNWDSYVMQMEQKYQAAAGQ
jgi:glycosyltransferase involved in cell wall biosynthesis